MITTNFSAINKVNIHRPNFGNSIDDEREKFLIVNREYIRENIGQPAYDTGVKHGRLLGVLLGILASLVTGIGVQSCQDDNDTNAKRELMSRFSKMLNGKNIKQDTFLVRDVNEDKVPELILYKKDGSEVVFDIKNNKVLEGKVVNKTEYSEVK